MKINTPLSKLDVLLTTPIQYRLSTQSDAVLFNDFLGKRLSITYQHKILCVNCGKVTKRSFYQGFCYPCFLKSPFTSECIIKPELCRAHVGEGKDIEWEKENHDTDHIVYLSLTSGLKVGVTRLTQVPSRWIDQGAVQAIRFAETPNRYLAGLIEIDIAKYVTDKTAWQRMLKSDYPELDLVEEKARLLNLLNPEFSAYISTNDYVENLEYPQQETPAKVKSINFEKVDSVSGVLTGIKGQYLIFDNETVLNIRKHGGYVVEIIVSENIEQKNTLF
jgi:hypothetical protein